MKIAHVITSFSLGGAEQVAEDISIALRPHGVRCDIIALLRPTPDMRDFSTAMKARLEAAGVAIHELSGWNRRVGMLAQIPALRRLLLREPFDLVHAHVDHAELAVSLVRRTMTMRCARTVHNTVFWPGHPVLAQISERGFKNDLVIAVSGDAMEAHKNMRRATGLPLTPHRQVIRNGVPLRTPEHALHGPARLAYFGRSTPQKGLDILLTAIARLPADLPEFRFDIYSDIDASSPQTRDAARREGVRLHPPAADARRRMGDYDAIVMPSRFEGIGLVALEAFTAGTPVLATRAPGLVNALPDEWPWSVPPGDAPALSARIADAIRAPETLRALRERAAEHGRGFDIANTAQEYLDAYRGYLALSV